MWLALLPRTASANAAAARIDMKTKLPLLVVVTLAGALLAWSWLGNDCPPGTAECPCADEASCSEGLQCIDERCAPKALEATSTPPKNTGTPDQQASQSPRTARGALELLPPIHVGEPAGWFELDSGVRGALRAFAYSEDSSVTLRDVSGTSFCMSGAAEPARCESGACDFRGAGAGFSLNQQNDGPERPYDAATAGVKGFTFEIDGSDVPNGLLFKALVEGDSSEYCAFVRAGSHTVRFTDLKRDCKAPTRGAVDERRIVAVQWEVSKSDRLRPFDLCVRNLRISR